MAHAANDGAIATMRASRYGLEMLLRGMAMREETRNLVQSMPDQVCLDDVSIWEHSIELPKRRVLGIVRVISRQAMREFWERHPDARQALSAWFCEAERADWGSPAAIKTRYVNASVIGGNRVVFNIKGNTYRLVVKIPYARRVAYIRFVGTHAEYDAINLEEV
jgi:mRNA interferase HigB